MTTTLNPDPWATLPPDWRTPKPKPNPAPVRPPASYYRPLPELKLPDVTCRPHCRRCHHPEGRGQCKVCVIVCDHTKKPKPVEVCIIRGRVEAAERRGPGSGRIVLFVADCPHCHRPHTHSVEPSSPFRKPPCGNPYLIERTPA